jgi:uncharacterized Zn finger protein
MDTGNGTFETMPSQGNISFDDLQAMKTALEVKYSKHGGWFQVGEIVELKGSRFRVKNIKPTQITLKLLPKE